MKEWLTHIIAQTAWEMTPPKAYGAFHLSFVLIGFAVCFAVAYLLRRAGSRVKKTLLLSVGMVLLLGEVYKQLFYTYYIGGGAYQWWIFPFQLCSVPMYLCLIAPLLPWKRVRHGMYHFMMLYNLLGGAISFAEPSGLIHPYWTLTLHAFIWHMLLVFVGLYLGLSEQIEVRAHTYRNASLVFVSLCVVAFCINLIFWEASGGSINMFFVGPKNSSLAVFSWFAENFGWYVSTALYIPAVCLGTYVIYLPFRHYKRKKGSAKQESETV